MKAFIKYGINNFSLVILEYTDSDKVIACEQKRINDLKPKYNVNLTAVSTKGYKHTSLSIIKIREA